MASKLGYSTREQQEAYEKLPEDDKAILFAHHWDTANNINRAMQGPKTIEIAGYTILAMPLESMSLTPEQQKKFKEAGGIEIDCSTMSDKQQKKFAKDNPNALIDWQVSFETLEEEIDGKLYEGFDLFKKVYEAFPDIKGMNKDEAKAAGLYPIIHYRNFYAREWMAEMYGGHLATLDIDNPEIDDIYRATKGKSTLKKLASIGQAPLGERSAYSAEIYNFGSRACLGSSSLHGQYSKCLIIPRDLSAFNDLSNPLDSISGVVVLDK